MPLSSTDKPYDVVARALSALRDAEPYGRNPTVVPDHGRESGEEAYSLRNPQSGDGDGGGDSAAIAAPVTTTAVVIVGRCDCRR